MGVTIDAVLCVVEMLEHTCCWYIGGVFSRQFACAYIVDASTCTNNIYLQPCIIGEPGEDPN